MKRSMMAAALVAALSVSACSFSDGVNKLDVAVGTTLGTANNVLARLAGNEIPVACSIIKTADGYFRELEPRISAKNIAIERKAMATVDAICSAPPANVGQAFGTLVKLWFAIQNATKTN